MAAEQCIHCWGWYVWLRQHEGQVQLLSQLTGTVHIHLYNGPLSLWAGTTTTTTTTITTVLWLWILSRTTWVSRYQKGKSNLDLLEQEMVSGSVICWTVCKSALHPRQIAMPAPHHSVFYRPDTLPAAQPTASLKACVSSITPITYMTVILVLAWYDASCQHIDISVTCWQETLLSCFFVVFVVTH